MMRGLPRAAPAPAREAAPSNTRTHALPRVPARVAGLAPPGHTCAAPKPGRGACPVHAAPTQAPASTPSALPAVPVDLAVEDAWKAGDPPTALMQDRISFLAADLPHLFDDVGIDAAAYAPDVKFLDPITRYSSLKGYLFNIAALRRVFAPTFVLLGARQTAPRTVTTRWAMTMVAAPLVPLLGGRAPSLAFTGVSVMTVDAAGRFDSHEDRWDAIDDQAYFSAEGAAHVAAQLADVRRAPGGLWTPPYGLLRKQKGGLEVRAYDPFDVVEARWVGNTGGLGGEAAARAGLFRALAGVLGDTGAAMTTPVLTGVAPPPPPPTAAAVAMEEVGGGRGGRSSGAPAPPGAMRFALSPADAARVRAALAAGTVRPPPGIEVAVVAVPAATVAALPLDGREPAAAAAALRARLASDFAPGGAVVADGGAFTRASYNSPATLPRFRREEVLLPLQEFDVWA